MTDQSLKPYATFALMIFVSMAVMYGVMYLHTYEWGHVYFSETRLYMTLLMGSTMALVMLAFMRGMYTNRRANIAVVALSILSFAGSLWLVRGQFTVDDSSYMRAMIPHHSIAILTSGRAEIKDVRVRALADDIIKAQRIEIDEMQWLLKDIERQGIAASKTDADKRPIPKFDATTVVD